MTDFKNDTKKAMIRAWKTTYKSSLKPFTYSRDLESTTVNPNNDTSGSQPYYDPVTGQYVHPTGTAENISEPFTGLPRSAEKDAGKDPALHVTDVKMTMLYDTFFNAFSTMPYTSDTVVYEGKDYRVVKYKKDSIDCFIHLFIRGI